MNNVAARWIAKLPSATDGQIDRVAKRFALIGLSGEIATRFGLTGWDYDEGYSAAEQAFADWYERRYSARRNKADAFVKILQHFLDGNLASLTHVNGPHTEGAEPIGWRDEAYAYLPKETWAKIFSSADGASAAKALLGMQMLRRGDSGHLGHKRPRTIPGPRIRVHTVFVDRVMAYRVE